jgi:hypothetical protein
MLGMVVSLAAEVSRSSRPTTSTTAQCNSFADGAKRWAENGD